MSILFLLIIIFNQNNNVYAKNQEKLPIILCNQPYALCSAAKCIPDPRHAGYALCRCDVYTGVSAGFISCQKRTPVTNKDHTQRIVSTFSFENSDNPSMICPAGTLWTDCVDAPCTVNPENTKKALCSCPIKNQSTIITFGGNCQTNTCNTGFWSGATLEVSSMLRNVLGRTLKSEQQENKQCPKK